MIISSINQICGAVFFVPVALLAGRSHSFSLPIGTTNKIQHVIHGVSVPIIHREQKITTLKYGCSNNYNGDCDECDECNFYTNSTESNLGTHNNIMLSENSLAPSSIPVHTSRRKFIQYTTAAISSLSGFSATSARAEINDPTIKERIPMATNKKNIIAVPLAPLAPFSTTRTYRNIVLSNGLQVVLVKDTLAQRASVALSIDGAGQFSDPEEIPGLAHLMEHIVLSSNSGGRSKVMQRKARNIWRNGESSSSNRIDKNNNIENDNDTGEEDFEDWLSNNDGDSNAFTAPGFVCFHFNGPHEILPEGLERFARLFTIEAIENTVNQNPFKIPREIRRVDSELDRTSDQSRAFYWLKSNFDNPQHPFSRLGAGSRETLLVNPAEKGIDVGPYLLRFFRENYIASKATLVVVGRDEVRTLDRWISPFFNVMSQKVKSAGTCLERPYFPDPMIEKGTQTIILRSKDDAQYDENIQTLCMEWLLSLSYTLTNCDTRQSPTQYLISATSVGFVLSQIISRRGPGSLRYFLDKFGWTPKGGTRGVPRITFPVDVNGFQILRMEIGLTNDGFSNRSAVVAAVFESIRTIISKPLQLDLIKQYFATAWLHGYLFAPRPPDAISLAVDAQRFGIGGIGGIGVQGNWHLMPSPEDDASVENMRQVITETLRIMADEEIALISIRASSKAIFQFSGGVVDQRISTPPLFNPWKVERVTGARYIVESRAYGGSSYFKSLYWFAGQFDGEQLSPPYLNPLIPTKFRAPRPVIERHAAWGGRRYLYLDDANAYENPIGNKGGSLKLTNEVVWSEFQLTQALKVDPSGEGLNWKLWQITPGYKDLIGLPLPMRPPEPTIECVFVVQLLSPLPSALASNQLGCANLWLLSFDDEILDLAELGAIAGIAYETSLNSAGIRLCFRGVSQTLPSYVRRFCRRFVQHHVKLFDGTTKISESVYQRALLDASRSPKINRLRRQKVTDFARRVSERDVAIQGSSLLQSVNGGYLISQGDILPKESLKLLSELQLIFRDFASSTHGFVSEPDLPDLMYRPFWKPRSSSPCLLPGVALISDMCGRVPR